MFLLILCTLQVLLAAKVSANQDEVRTVILDKERSWRLSTKLLDDVNNELDEKHYYALYATKLAVQCLMPDGKAHVLFVELVETKCDRRKTMKSGRQFDCVYVSKGKSFSCKIDRVKKNNSTRLSGVVCSPGESREPQQLLDKSKKDSASICEQLHYPKSTIRRLSVPEEFKRWSIRLPAYNPPNYSPDLWPNVDDLCKKNRFSSDSKDMVSTEYGIPASLNPSGRTGVAGKGYFPCFGPNAIIIPILMRSNKGTLEALVDLKKWRGGKNLAFPHAFEPNPHKFPLGRKLTGALREALKRKSGEPEAKKIIKILKESMRESNNIVYKGIVNSSVNTDNSWVQLIAYALHDRKGDSIGAMDLRDEESTLGMGWREVADMKADLNEILLFSLMPSKTLTEFFQFCTKAKGQTAASWGRWRLRDLLEAVPQFNAKDALSRSEYLHKGAGKWLASLILSEAHPPFSEK